MGICLSCSAAANFDFVYFWVLFFLHFRYGAYFNNLNPVLDGGVGGFADMEEELANAMKGSTTANTGN